MTLVGLILNFTGTLFLLFAQPQFKYEEQLGSIVADIKPERKQKIFWRLGFILLAIGFFLQATPSFIQWLCAFTSV